MKKIFCLILIVIIMMVSITNISASDYVIGQPYEVYFTPIFDPLQATYGEITISQTGTYNKVSTWYAEIDYTADELAYLNSSYDSAFYNATRLSPATAFYNCHSYAWYSQNYNTNRYWIDNPSAYYKYSENLLYVQVSTPQPGDRICYIDNKGTSSVLDDTNEHSGIVTKVLTGTSNGLCGNSDLVMVTSKWGVSGLYLHNGYECPYTAYAGGITDTVKYYRKMYHSHSYTRTDYGSLDDHQITCSCVSTTMYENHTWSFGYVGASVYDVVSPDAIPVYTCTGCGAQAYSQPPNYVG